MVQLLNRAKCFTMSFIMPLWFWIESYKEEPASALKVLPGGSREHRRSTRRSGQPCIHPGGDSRTFPEPHGELGSVDLPRPTGSDSRPSWAWPEQGRAPPPSWLERWHLGLPDQEERPGPDLPSLASVATGSGAKSRGIYLLKGQPD